MHLKRRGWFETDMKQGQKLEEKLLQLLLDEAGQKLEEKLEIRTMILLPQMDSMVILNEVCEEAGAW